MKISRWQLFWIFIFSGNAYYALNPALIYAKQDAWISLTLATIITLVCTYFLAKLSLLYSGKTIVEYSQIILGKWLGRLILLPYFFTWYLMILSFLRDFTGFINIAVLIKTPLIVVKLVMLFLMLYLLYLGGLTSISRVSELVGPLFILITYGLLFLNYDAMDWKQITPIYVDSGWGNIVKSTFICTILMVRLAFLPLMLFAFLPKPKQGVKPALWGSGFILSSLILSVVAVIFHFGPKLSTNVIFPIFIYIKMIFILDFIQNLDVLSIPIWVFMYLILLSTFTFMLSYGMAQFWNSKEWRKYSIVILLLIGIGIYLAPKTGMTTNFLSVISWYPWLIIIDIVVIPLFLWIVHLIKHRSKTASHNL